MQLDVPFYGNTEDNTHCFQAGIRMVLKHFYPDEEYSWEELERVSAKAPGMWTWPMAAYIWLSRKGLEVKNIEVFDYEKFSQDPEGYLHEIFTPEVAKAQIEHADMKEEAARAAVFVSEFETIKAIPSIDDIKGFLDEGYVVAVNINSKALNRKEGYSGHFVIVIGYDEEGLIMHDPGIPPKPHRHVDYATFERAWAYPDENAKNLAAFKRREKNNEDSI